LWRKLHALLLFSNFFHAIGTHWKIYQIFNQFLYFSIDHVKSSIFFINFYLWNICKVWGSNPGHQKKKKSYFEEKYKVCFVMPCVHTSFYFYFCNSTYVSTSHNHYKLGTKNSLYFPLSLSYISILAYVSFPLMFPWHLFSFIFILALHLLRVKWPP